MKVYIATAFEHRKTIYRRAVNSFEGRGHTITWDWNKGCHEGGHNDLDAVNDIVGVVAADMVLMLLPGGKGTHAELGAALALDVPVVIVSPTRCWGPGESVFYDHPTVKQKMVCDYNSPRAYDAIVELCEQVKMRLDIAKRTKPRVAGETETT